MIERILSVMTGHNTIGAGARVGGGSIVWSDVEPGAEYVGSPARPKAEYLKATALFHRMPQLMERIAALEARIRELESGGEAS